MIQSTEHPGVPGQYTRVFRFGRPGCSGLEDPGVFELNQLDDRSIQTRLHNQTLLFPKTDNVL